MNGKKVWIAALVVAATLVTLGGMTDAQQLQLGDAGLQVNGSPVLTAQTFGLSGTIVSAVAIAPDGGSTTLYTTPGTGQFILTQLCFDFSHTPGSSLLAGGTFGEIGFSGANCVEYKPGLALPQNEILTLSDGNGGTNQTTIATLTGVHQP